MDPVTLAIFGMLGLITAVGEGLLNREAKKQENEANLQLNRENNLLQQQIEEARNQAQIERDREANETTRFLTEHAHQIEMADLEAAGLNPILTAMGGTGASVPTQVVNPLSSAKTNAGRVEATPFDLSGVTNMIQSITSMMLMHSLMNTGVRADYYSKQANYIVEKTIGQEVFNEAMPGLYGTKIGLQDAKANYYRAHNYRWKSKY